MRHYSKEKQELLKSEIELAMRNLSKCITFALTNKKSYYENEQLFGEYSMLNDLKEVLSYCMIDGEDMEVCNTDYLLIKKWGWLNLQTYIDLSSDIEV